MLVWTCREAVKKPAPTSLLISAIKALERLGVAINHRLTSLHPLITTAVISREIEILAFEVVEVEVEVEAEVEEEEKEEVETITSAVGEVVTEEMVTMTRKMVTATDGAIEVVVPPLLGVVAGNNSLQISTFICMYVNLVFILDFYLNSSNRPIRIINCLFNSLLTIKIVISFRSIEVQNSQL